MTAHLRELLEKSDEDLFRKGGCHIYAVELKRFCPHLRIKHAGLTYSIGDIPKALHVYAAFADFKIDVLGPKLEADYLRGQGYTAWDVSTGELMTIDPSQYTENGPLNRWRHYLDSEFVSLASARALLHIERHLHKWKAIAPSIR